jgi:hypothetical protein
VLPGGAVPSSVICSRATGGGPGFGLAAGHEGALHLLLARMLRRSRGGIAFGARYAERRRVGFRAGNARATTGISEAIRTRVPVSAGRGGGCGMGVRLGGCRYVRSFGGFGAAQGSGRFGRGAPTRRPERLFSIIRIACGGSRRSCRTTSHSRGNVRPRATAIFSASPMRCSSAPPVTPPPARGSGTRMDLFSRSGFSARDPDRQVVRHGDRGVHMGRPGAGRCPCGAFLLCRPRDGARTR